MAKVFVSIGMSLDGFMAGPNRGPANPLGDRGTKVHERMFQQRAFRENLKLGEGGDTGPDNRILEATFRRIGANIMGMRMFEEGEANWPEEAPFHTSVFVLTKRRRDPWKRPGGTTFYFIRDGIERALEQAKEAAGDKDVRISGGANVIQQYLNAGLVDELSIPVAPILLGQGLRPFDGVDPNAVTLELVDTPASRLVTHLRYRVTAKG